MMLSSEPDSEIYCFGVRFGEDPRDLAAAPVVMVPTDSALDGIFDRYLYLTIDGEKYRFERQETMPDGIQAGPEVATVYEDTGLGDSYSYTVFSVEGCTDDSMMLVHSGDMDMMWLYKYSPSKAADENALQNAKDAGYVVMEDGDVTRGRETWLDFYEKTRQGTSASVKLAYYYTLDPERCSKQFYEAYKEDYPRLFLQALTYDGESYTLRWNEYGTECVRSYEYLMRYSDAGYGPADNDNIQYVLTHDNTVTWGQILNGLFSSQSGAYIDHYTVYTDKT